MDKSHSSKPIPDFPGYAVMSDGRIMSLSRKVWNGKGFLITKEKELRGNVIGKGYLQVTLYRNKKRVQKLIHVLVAEAFIPKGNPLFVQVNHKDGNKLNNSVSNLEWCDNSRNQLHAWSHGLQPPCRAQRTAGGTPVAEIDKAGNIIKKYSHARHAEVDIFGDYKRRISCALRHGGTVYGHKFIKL